MSHYFTLTLKQISKETQKLPKLNAWRRYQQFLGCKKTFRNFYHANFKVLATNPVRDWCLFSLPISALRKRSDNLPHFLQYRVINLDQHILTHKIFTNLTHQTKSMLNKSTYCVLIQIQVTFWKTTQDIY